MPKNKRLRVFAGPNGSGKSTLFNDFKNIYDPGYFINADELEKSLNATGLIDLEKIGINATTKDLLAFAKLKEAKTLLAKTSAEGYSIQLAIRDNFIVRTTGASHSYEASYAAAFIRHMLYKAIGHSPLKR
jgi:ABC-type branched-subunit amino acid transport system ATPase component